MALMYASNYPVTVILVFHGSMVLVLPLTLYYNFFPGDVLTEPLAVVEGYNSYFSFSRSRSGYSGKWGLLGVFNLVLVMGASSSEVFWYLMRR